MGGQDGYGAADEQGRYQAGDDMRRKVLDQPIDASPQDFYEGIHCPLVSCLYAHYCKDSPKKKVLMERMS